MKERLKEPSTYSGMAAAITPAYTIPGAQPYVAGAQVILGLIAMFTKEAGAKDK